MASYENKEWQATPTMEPRDSITKFEQPTWPLTKSHRTLSKVNFRTAFPMYIGLMEEVIEGIMEEAQVMSRTLGAVLRRIPPALWRFSGVCSHLEVCWCPTISTKGLQQCTSHSTRRILWMAEDEECRQSHPPHLASPKWMADVDQEPGRTTIADSQWSTETTHQYDINCAKCYWIQLLRWKTVFCRAHCGTLQDDADADIPQQHPSPIQITTGNIGSGWLYGTDFRFCSSDHSWPVHFEPTLRVQMQQCKLFAPLRGGVCVKTPGNRVKWFLNRMTLISNFRGHLLGKATCSTLQRKPISDWVSSTFRYVEIYLFPFELTSRGVGVWLRSLQPTKTLLMS